jgi:hypothetical protein
MRATCLSEREFCPFPEFGAEAFLIAPAQGDKSPRLKNSLQNSYKMMQINTPVKMYV